MMRLGLIPKHLCEGVFLHHTRHEANVHHTDNIIPDWSLYHFRNGDILLLCNKPVDIDSWHLPKSGRTWVRLLFISGSAPRFEGPFKIVLPAFPVITQQRRLCSSIRPRLSVEPAPKPGTNIVDHRV